MPEFPTSPEHTSPHRRAVVPRSVPGLLLMAGGLISLGLGIVGAFLPILPTTPLVLLAAFCFSRSSPALHGWLLRNRLMGPMIRDWQHHGAIGRRAKVTATVMIVLLCGYTVAFSGIPLLIGSLVALVCLGVVAFILTRPTRQAALAAREPEPQTAAEEGESASSLAPASSTVGD